MARTSYAAGAAEVGAFWSKRLAHEALKATASYKYLGETADSMGMIVPDTEKGGGDNVTVTLRMQPTGDGVSESQPQEGNEESLVTYTDKVTINELSHAFRQRTGIVDQRIPWDIGMEMNDALRDWWSARIDQVNFNHLCGNSLQTDARYTGFNTVQSPAAGRIIRATGSDDVSLGSTNVFTLALIDQAVEIAKTGGSTGLPPIRPIKVEGEDFYLCFIHPTQTTSLRSSSSQWQTINQYMLQGGVIAKNPIFTGALGVYNRTIIVESTRLCKGISNASAYVSSTRRAVFAGAQALSLAFGKGFGPKNWKVTEETFDFGRQAAQSGLCIYGVKAARYNSSDFGKIVISTYAADAA